MIVFYHSVTSTEFDIIKEKELYAVSLQHKLISEVFSTITSDILFLSEQNELRKYISSNNKNLLKNIIKEYTIISKNKKIYDQIRFLDSSGMEIIRVNHNDDAPLVVPDNQLQSKYNRYYFSDCFKLNKEEIFISPFDLNVEQDKIEQPYKPMIRLGTPVFNTFGQKSGIVLVNYFGKKLLDNIQEFEPISEGETMLLNAEGYWLLNPKSEREWGFMFKDPQQTLSALDQDAWKQISSKDQGQIETSEGVYTFKTVYPVKNEKYRSSTGSPDAFGQSSADIDHDAYHWHLVSFLSADKIESMTNSFLMKFFIIGAGLFFLISTGSWMIAFAITKRQLYQGQLQIMAFLDPLTKLPNRALFFDRLKMTAEHSRRYGSQFGLLYIDLDGFKQVNDSLGHEVGDDLLKTVSNRFLRTCRESDTVARMGGDEFAIIYSEFASLSDLEAFASRIIDSLAPPIELAKGTVTIGASIGISIFPMNSKNIEELISIADKAMYESKRRGKNNFTLATTSMSNDV
jgi:diguanylate cyclase (GGDEF)-like protein